MTDSNLLTQSPFHANSIINQAIGSKFVELGYHFSATTALEAVKKEFPIRYWYVRFTIPNQTPSVLTINAFYLDNSIRFWTSIIADRKLTDAERVAISELLRETYRYARVSIDNKEISSIIIEADFYVDSVVGVTTGLIDIAMSNTYHPSLRIITDYNFKPA